MLCFWRFCFFLCFGKFQPDAAAYLRHLYLYIHIYIYVRVHWLARGWTWPRQSVWGRVYIYIYIYIEISAALRRCRRHDTNNNKNERRGSPKPPKKRQKTNISRPGLPTNFPQMISLFFNLPTISLIKGNWQGLSHNLLPQSLPTISHNFPTIPGTPFSCAQ